MEKRSIITNIPDLIDVKQTWLVEYWANELGVTIAGLNACISHVGPSAGKIRSFLKKGYRIALEDKNGAVRLIARIKPLDDGFSLMCPYHTETKGWIVKTPINYAPGVSTVPISESEQFSVSDTVKLSLHMTGFVQFSSGTGNRIVSGYCDVLKAPKGVGLKSPDSVVVTSGPLCGINVRGLGGFQLLHEEKAEVFKREDLWYHPDFPSDSDVYLVEIFMLPIDAAKAAEQCEGKRLLKKFLPFNATFTFPHTLRIIELPNLWFCLGVIICPGPFSETITTGYTLSSPGMGEPGKQKYAISAWYPRPAMLSDLQSKSLDYFGPDEAIVQSSSQQDK